MRSPSCSPLFRAARPESVMCLMKIWLPSLTPNSAGRGGKGRQSLESGLPDPLRALSLSHYPVRCPTERGQARLPPSHAPGGCSDTDNLIGHKGHCKESAVTARRLQGESFPLFQLLEALHPWLVAPPLSSQPAAQLLPALTLTLLLPLMGTL